MNVKIKKNMDTDRTARTGQPGQDSQGRKARIGQPEKDSTNISAIMGQPKRDRQDGTDRKGTGRTGNAER